MRKGGFVFGGSDDGGRESVTDAMRISDFNATLAAALRLPLDEATISPSRRPSKAADKGKPGGAVVDVTGRGLAESCICHVE